MCQLPTKEGDVRRKPLAKTSSKTFAFANVKHRCRPLTVLCKSHDRLMVMGTILALRSPCDVKTSSVAVVERLSLVPHSSPKLAVNFFEMTVMNWLSTKAMVQATQIVQKLTRKKFTCEML